MTAPERAGRVPVATTRGKLIPVPRCGNAPSVTTPCFSSHVWLRRAPALDRPRPAGSSQPAGGAVGVGAGAEPGAGPGPEAGAGS